MSRGYRYCCNVVPTCSVVDLDLCLRAVDQHSFFVYSDPAILLNADPDSVYQNLYGNKLPYEEFSAVEKDKKIDQNYKKKPWT